MKKTILILGMLFVGIVSNAQFTAQLDTTPISRNEKYLGYMTYGPPQDIQYKDSTKLGQDSGIIQPINFTVLIIANGNKIRQSESLDLFTPDNIKGRKKYVIAAINAYIKEKYIH